MRVLPASFSSPHHPRGSNNRDRSSSGSSAVKVPPPPPHDKIATSKKTSVKSQLPAARSRIARKRKIQHSRKRVTKTSSLPTQHNSSTSSHKQQDKQNHSARKPSLTSLSNLQRQQYPDSSTIWENTYQLDSPLIIKSTELTVNPRHQSARLRNRNLSARSLLLSKNDPGTTTIARKRTRSVSGQNEMEVSIKKKHSHRSISIPRRPQTAVQSRRRKQITSSKRHHYSTSQLMSASDNPFLEKVLSPRTPRQQNDSSQLSPAIDTSPNQAVPKDEPSAGGTAVEPAKTIPEESKQKSQEELAIQVLLQQDEVSTGNGVGGWPTSDHGTSSPISEENHSSKTNIFHGGMIPRKSNHRQAASPPTPSSQKKSKWNGVGNNSTHSPSSKRHTFTTQPTSPNSKSSPLGSPSNLSLQISDDDEDRIKLDLNTYSPLRNSTRSSHRHHLVEDLEISSPLGGVTPLSEQNNPTRTRPSSAPSSKKFTQLSYLKSSRKQQFKRRLKQLVQAYSSTHDSDPEILKKRYQLLIRSLADAEMVGKQQFSNFFRSKSQRFAALSGLSNPPSTRYSPHESKDLLAVRPKSAIHFSKPGAPRFARVRPSNPRVCYGQSLDLSPPSTARTPKTPHTHRSSISVQSNQNQTPSPNKQREEPLLPHREEYQHPRPASAWSKAPQRFDSPDIKETKQEIYREILQERDSSKGIDPSQLGIGKRLDMQYLLRQLEEKNRNMDERLVQLVEAYDYFQREDLIAEEELQSIEKKYAQENNKKPHRNRRSSKNGKSFSRKTHNKM